MLADWVDMNSYPIVGAHPCGRPVGGRPPRGRRKAVPLPMILLPFNIREVFLYLGRKRTFGQILRVIRVKRPS